MNVHRLIWLPAIVICINACAAQQTSFIDVQQKQIVTLKKRPDQGNIYSLAVRAEGEVDGQATISLVDNNKVLYTENISGVFKVDWGGD
jgi:hypothetical protein